MKVDLSKTKTFEPPAEAKYPGTIVSAEEGTTEAGHSKVDIRWEVEEDGVVKSVMMTMPIEGPGAFKAQQLLIAIGMANTPEEVKQLDFDCGDLLGQQALLTIKHRVYSEERGGDGSVRANVQKMQRLKGSAGASATGGSGLFGRGK
jgi:hypothetical protein